MLPYAHYNFAAAKAKRKNVYESPIHFMAQRYAHIRKP